VLKEGCTNPGRQVAVATKLRTVTRNVCKSSLWNLLHLTLLAPSGEFAHLCVNKFAVHPQNYTTSIKNALCARHGMQIKAKHIATPFQLKHYISLSTAAFAPQDRLPKGAS
jgi:hypothetical protein